MGKNSSYAAILNIIQLNMFNSILGLSTLYLPRDGVGVSCSKHVLYVFVVFSHRSGCKTDKVVGVFKCVQGSCSPLWLDESRWEHAGQWCSVCGWPHRTVYVKNDSCLESRIWKENVRVLSGYYILWSLHWYKHCIDSVQIYDFDTCIGIYYH